MTRQKRQRKRQQSGRGAVPAALVAAALLATGCGAADTGGPAPHPGLDAFHAQDCPELTGSEKENGNLITLTHDQPEEGVPLRPGGDPATVLVKLCNTTDRPLTGIALSAQLEWSDAGERDPLLTVEHRETPDGRWRTADLVVANDYDPLRGADAARDLAPGATRVVEYRFTAAEEAPSGARPLTIHAVRAGADPDDAGEQRGGGLGGLRLSVLPKD
ncbi:hypothetical protein [Streptomyces koyangensis]|uniref:DUF4232 domain-containing protein n=1 Tax=Streptomyces koyangensis TaxID=188770 RepID=A0ABX7ED86_9ACTN|nr:hypothetical protein [Streptomyces koyangensis]QRF02358.1 hypothetical protein G9U55_09240 [Streptomyces koyangensis]